MLGPRRRTVPEPRARLATTEGKVVRRAWYRRFNLRRRQRDETASAMSSERRIPEEALRESEQRWRSLTEALPQLVWSAAPDGACDYFSTQWTEYTGVAERELLGWRWMDVLHPDDRQSIRQIWTDSVAGRRAYDVEY